MANNSVTFRYQSPAYELISDVTIMKPGFKNIPSSKKLLTRALWDTGSDGCMIDETVASNLGLEVTGNIMIAGIHGVKEVNEYIIDILITDKIRFNKVSAASVRGLDEGYNVFIGMDIINKGGFAVTQNQNGGTTMSFTMPCLREIDFQSE